MAVNLPAFENTPVDQIPKIVDQVRSTFLTQKTKPIEFRLKQLRKLYWG
jgi:beta-apo-4'-carotenal oxygenase